MLIVQGYIFLAPHSTEQMGPYIYDKLGVSYFRISVKTPLGV